MTHSTARTIVAPMSRTRPASLRSRERGAALVVGLVLMLALTILGVSGMNMATLELTMAGNEQSQHTAFQRAETGIERAIAQPANPGATLTITGDEDGDGTVDIRSTTTFAGNTLVPDGEGWSTDMTAYHFDTVSVGRAGQNAVSTHNQSFYVIGPSAE